MNLKQRIQLKWHRFLITQKSKMEEILAEKFPEMPPNYPAHAMTVNEYQLDYDPDEQIQIMRSYMKRRLGSLKADIHKTVAHNNGKLTLDQIQELEYIKSNLTRLDSLDKKNYEPK